MQLSDDVVSLLRNPETPNGVLHDAILDSTGYDMATVYVVYGTCSEYSDYREWFVVAFLDEAKANDYCERCNKWCMDERIHRDYEGPTHPTWEERDAINNRGHPLDDQFDKSHDSVNYLVGTVPLRAE